MRNIVFVLLVIIFTVEINGQTISGNLEGKISYLSSQNVYVKFNSTTGISVGDTLFIQSNGGLLPALAVNNMSSISCICSPVSTIKLSVADVIIARVKTKEKNPEGADNALKEIVVPVIANKSDSESNRKAASSEERKQIIKGSTSLSSYTDISSTDASNSQRFRYTFLLDAGNIADSRFSVESYFSFKYKVGEWESVKNNIFSALKIYNLAVRYSPDNTTQISVGRRINPRISSIGASDGLQVEKSFQRFSIGALVGTRPDYTDYGFNSKLLQYGGYLAFNSKNARTYTESSVAFMQQMNNSKTDRRFLYFQHSNSIIRNLSFFSTFEVDLYKLKADSLNNYKSQNTFDLTGLYLSLNYRLGRVLTITGSYDARKNVMYYETYKTFIDRILEDEFRQGFRLQANYRITRNLIIGIHSGYRYLKSDPHPSKNFYGYVAYSQIPGVKMSATLSATYLESAFMNGNIFGLNLSRDFFKGKIQTGAGYRYVDYRLPENQMNILQNIGELNLSWQLAKKMFFSLNYEGTFEHKDKYNRLYLQLRRRF